MLSTLQKLNLYLRIISFWKIPLLFSCRPQIILLNESSVKFKIKLRRRTKNHLGSMYLGALAIGADITSGYFAFHHLNRYNENISIIFKDFHADFNKRAMGDVVFTCSSGIEIKEKIKETIETKKRINFPVAVIATVPSISEEVVARFTLTLSIKAK